MPMTITKIENPIDDKQVWQLVIPGELFAAMNLNEMDRLLLKECGESDLVSDKLLALETIARKIEELTPGEPKFQVLEPMGAIGMDYIDDAEEDARAEGNDDN